MPTGLYADLVFLLFSASVVGMLVMMARQASLHWSPDQKTYISLSVWSLPKYTLLSLGAASPLIFCRWPSR